MRMMAPGAAPMSAFASFGPPPGCPAPGAAPPGCPAPGAAPPGCPAPGAARNVQFTVERGQKLSDIEDRAEYLSSDSKEFANASAALKKKYAASQSVVGMIKMQSNAAIEKLMGGINTTVDLSQKSDMEKILHIASSQSAVGMFKMDKAIEKLIGENKVEKFKRASEGKSISVEKWWTALVIAFVQKNFAKEKDTWELFIQKASDWLNNDALITEAVNSFSI